MSNLEGFNPNWVSKPGATINDILEERKISILDFSMKLGMSVDDCLKLIKAELEIDLVMAKKLEKVIGSSTKFWLKREKTYREGLAKGLKN